MLSTLFPAIAFQVAEGLLHKIVGPLWLNSDAAGGCFEMDGICKKIVPIGPAGAFEQKPAVLNPIAAARVFPYHVPTLTRHTTTS